MDRINAEDATGVAIKNMWLSADDIIEYLTSLHAMRNKEEESDANKSLALDIVSGVRDWLTSGDGFKAIGLQV